MRCEFLFALSLPPTEPLADQDRRSEIRQSLPSLECRVRRPGVRLVHVLALPPILDDSSCAPHYEHTAGAHPKCEALVRGEDAMGTTDTICGRCDQGGAVTRTSDAACILLHWATTAPFHVSTPVAEGLLNISVIQCPLNDN